MSTTLVNEIGGVKIASNAVAAPEDARVTLLRVPGQFRLDVKLGGDTFRTVVRGLAGRSARVSTPGYSKPVVALTPMGGLSPSCHELTLELAGPGGPYEIPVQIAVMRDPSRGVVTFSAQATLERA